jgi:Flp pilus assembly secretin CpaC
MRRLLLALTAPLAVLSSAPMAHAAPTLVVPIDHSAAVSLPRGTRDVLIGNPTIADVSILDSGKAVILGKGYGSTNLVVVDQLGRTVLERQIVVSAPAGRVSVIRGARVDDYACAGGCERTGEPPKAP